jgi:ABC-type multidrug transport system permease subunit
MSSNYVALAVSAVIFISLFLYVLRLDKKVEELKKK